MKERIGFVSNSSSSSFIICRAKLSLDQIEKIQNHIDYYNEYFAELPGHYQQTKADSWSITVNEESVYGYVFMDNFPMDEFFERVGIADEDVEWNVGL